MATADPKEQAHGFIDRLEALLEEVHTFGRQLERPRPHESANAEAERILYFTLVSAIEAGLIRTMEDVLSVLRRASAPLGPMGAEWLARQERALKRGDG